MAPLNDEPDYVDDKRQNLGNWIINNKMELILIVVIALIFIIITLQFGWEF